MEAQSQSETVLRLELELTETTNLVVKHCAAADAWRECAENLAADLISYREDRGSDPIGNNAALAEFERLKKEHP